MTLFAVLSDKPNPGLSAKIATLYATDSYKINDSQWLVSADAIPQTLAEQLGLRSGTEGKAIVVEVSASASGWQMKSLWDWLRQKAGTT